MNPFRQPTENEEDFQELLKLDKEQFRNRTEYRYIRGKYVLVYDFPDRQEEPE